MSSFRSGNVFTAACLAACLAVGLAFAAGSARGELVYVASKSNGQLMRFDTANPSAVTVLSGTLHQPAALAFGSDGKLYIAEWGDSGNDNTPQVRRYDPATAAFSLVTTLPGSKPSALAFTPGGTMLVGRTGAGSMHGIANWSQGTVSVADFGPSLAGSTGIAVAPDGGVYVSDMSLAPSGSGFDIASGPVVRLTAAGEFDRQIVPDGSGTDGLSGPTGLALVGGSLYTASVMSGEIFKTTGLAGTPATELFSLLPDDFLSSPGSLIALADGSFLAGSALPSNNTIYRVAADGSELPAIVNPNFGQVGGIAVVPEPGTWVLLAAAAAAALARRLRGRNCRGRAA